jgi:hypothetical protein
LHGDAVIGPDDDKCIVKLEAYSALACEVVDRSGRAVEGAHVALSMNEGAPLLDHCTGITGEDGRVRFQKLELILSEGYRGPVWISLGAGVAEPRSVVFDLDSVPTDPVRLVVGDFGKVVVQLVDGQGSELGLEGSVDLEVGLKWSGNDARETLLERVSTPLHSGHATFGCVGLGYALTFLIHVDGYDAIRQDAHGPTAPGEEASVRITVRDQLATARGNVLGIQALLADTQSAYALLSGSPTGRSGEVSGFFRGWLSEDGYFECPIQYGTKDLPGPWALTLSNVGGPILSATVLPTVVEGRVLDFGDVVFDRQPALARLRVVDESGAAMRAATVDLSSSMNRRTWELDCNDQGGCLVMGSSFELPIQVRARHCNLLPSEWSQIAEPGGEHTLVLRRPAKLEGRLLVPGARNSEDLKLRLEVGSYQGGSTYLENPAEDGRFAFEHCEPGQGLLSVLHINTVVLERAGIELRSGETTALGPIDLTGIVYPFELSFALESREPWSHGQLLVRDADGVQGSWCGNATPRGLKPIGPSGRVSFFASRPAVDLWATGRGGRTALFQSVLNGDRLVLPSAPSVVLHVPREIPLPEPPLVLRVEAIPASLARGDREDDGRFYFSFPYPSAVVNEDGTAHLQVPLPGDYWLSWFVSHTGLSARCAVPKKKTQTVHVAESPSFGSTEANLTGDAVAEACLKLSAESEPAARSSGQ